VGAGGDTGKGSRRDRGGKARGRQSSGTESVSMRVAYIGAAATVVAALIALIPTIFFQGGNGSVPAGQPTTIGSTADPSGDGTSRNSPSSPAPATGSPGPVSAPATSSNNEVLLYKDKPFELYGAGCTDTNSYNNFPYVVFWPDHLVNVQVTTSQPGAPFDLVLNCSDRTIEYTFHAAIVSGRPDYDSCYSAVSQRFMKGGIRLSSLNLTTSLCLINIQGTELAVITLRSLADAATDTKWTASVYQILENS